MLHESGFDLKAGAIYLKTPCIESFRRILCGPLDELAIGCSKELLGSLASGGSSLSIC